MQIQRAHVLQNNACGSVCSPRSNLCWIWRIYETGTVTVIIQLITKHAVDALLI